MVTGVGGRALRQSLEGISLIQYPIPILMGWVVMVMEVRRWVANAIPQAISLMQYIIPILEGVWLGAWFCGNGYGGRALRQSL